jgi:Tfp pilus assembly protein PilV
MRKTQQGFSIVETLLAIIVIAAIAGLGFWVYHQNHKTTATNNSTTASNNTAAATTAGTTQSIDNLTQQDVTSEQAIDSRYASTDQTTTQSANGAAANMGGAFDETTF